MKIPLIAVLAMSLIPALADPPPSVPVMHAEARVVQIDVVVTDSHGKAVTDLTKQDFVVTDEGKPRAIDIFSLDRIGADRAQATPPAAATPSQSLPPHVFSNRNPRPSDPQGHSTVLVLDQINTYLEDAAYAREQVMSLLKKVPVDERIAIYAIARKEGLVLIHDYTTDRTALLESLTKYKPRGMTLAPPAPPTQANKSGNASLIGNAQALADAWAKGTDQSVPPGLPSTGATFREKLLMWQENSSDSRISLQALAEHLALVPGRKSIFWITQSFPPWLFKEVGMWTPPAMNTDAWNKTIAALNEANVAVNTVDSRGMFRGGDPNSPSNPLGGTLDTLQEIAGRTGGQAYIRRNDLDTAMEEGIETSRATYTLGFYLNTADRDNKFHALKVQAGRAGLQLFYRQGYYAGDTDMPDSSKNKSGASEPESALLNQIDSADVIITARIDSIVPNARRGVINLHVNLDTSTLSLSERPDGWAGSVEETFIETNDTGATLAKVADKKDFDIPAAARARFDADGVAWPSSIPLVGGAVKVTIVMRDIKSGRTGSLTVPLK
jgi:VWFA-related protein